MAKLEWVPICCVCDQVRDVRQFGERTHHRLIHADSEQWMPLKSFLERYGIGQEEYKLVDSYCSHCLNLLAKTGKGFERFWRL